MRELCICMCACICALSFWLIAPLAGDGCGVLYLFYYLFIYLAVGILDLSESKQCFASNMFIGALPGKHSSLTFINGESVVAICYFSFMQG